VPAKANYRQIALRLDDALFEAIDEKRHAMRVSLQSLARALFTAWLRDFPGPNVEITVAQVLRAENRHARVPALQAEPRLDERIPGHLQDVAARFLQFWESPDGVLEHRLKELFDALVLSEDGEASELLGSSAHFSGASTGKPGGIPS
jgi:hypothetical protein